MAGGAPRRSGGESLLSHGCAVPAPPEGKPRELRSVPAPRIYEGGGPRSGRGSPPQQRESPFSHGFAVPAPPEGKTRALRTVLAPRIYEGGRATQWQGEPPAAAAGKASSVTASPCQLPQRGSQGRFTPFLPPAFMRGEGHAVAGGVPRRSGGESPLSHASRASSPGGRAKGAAALSPFHATEIFPRIRTLQVLPHFQTYHAAMAFL